MEATHTTNSPTFERFSQVTSHIAGALDSDDYDIEAIARETFAWIVENHRNEEVEG